METQRPTVATAEEILNLYFPVLDHGFVALVDYMGGDEDVERAARVSYGKPPSRSMEATRGLIRYLRRHKHTTPSEMVELKFHCSMPIFIARQWIRHRTANVNETSGRYTLLPMLFYTPEAEQLCKQSQSNRQGRSDEALDGALYRESVSRWTTGRTATKSDYVWMAEHEVANELARIDLPLSTYTQWYWKIDLHNLMHFLGLRVDSHAQWEIQQYGKIMAGMMKRVAPLSFEAWMDYDVSGARFSRGEMDALRAFVVPGEGGRVLETTGNYSIDSAELEALGISGREVAELVAKFKPRGDAPDFELDLLKSRPASYFEQMMADAAPKLKEKK